VGGRVVVVGGGVAGLAAALALGRAGCAVTVLERDPAPTAEDPEAAFHAERRGAPQVHQTHGFLARLVVELRRRFPDVLDDLLAAGCTTMPTTMNLGEPQPGDEDLRVLIVRRTTFEWVLRRAVAREAGVDLRSGVGVAGVVGHGPGGVVGHASDNAVTGVRLEDGTVLDADAVVAATGRRGNVPAWLHESLGVDIPEKTVESGLMYLSRWYRFPGEVALDPKLGGDLGFVKYLAVPGDAGTLSVTLAIRADDAELRAALSDPDRFERACRALPGPDQFFRHGPLEPIGGVRPMGGLLNRRRRFLDDEGEPLVLGFHALGDAHTCTNPLYGRGCSLAVAQAGHLADAFTLHPDDAAARARAYEQAAREQVEPWFGVSVEMDRMGADPAGGPASPDSPFATVMAAAATDPVIGRAMVRFWNLLALPTDLFADAELQARIAEVTAEPEKYPLPPREGPRRSELLDELTPSEVA